MGMGLAHLRQGVHSALAGVALFLIGSAFGSSGMHVHTACTHSIGCQIQLQDPSHKEQDTHSH